MARAGRKRKAGPRLWNMLCSIVTWRAVFEHGCYAYMENAVTGKRKAVRISNGYSPLDTAWLAGGNHD